MVVAGLAVAGIITAGPVVMADVTPSPTAAVPSPAATPSATPSPSASPCSQALPWNVGCIPGAVGGAVGAAAGDAVTTTMFSGVTSWIIDGAQRGTAVLLGALVASDTGPDLHAAWFQSLYHGGGRSAGALAIASLLAVPVFAGAVLLALVRGDPAALIRLVLVRLPTAAFFAFASVALVTRLLALVDALSVWIMQGGISSLGAWNAQLTSSTVGQDFLSALICLLITFAALLAYVELLVRDAAVSIVVAFIPLIAVATLWPGARHALQKAGETLFALVVSKFVIAFVLTLGAGMITSQTAHGVAALAAGAIVLLLAAAAPFAVFRLLPGLEGAALGVVAGHGAAWTQRHVRRSGVGLGGAALGAVGGGIALGVGAGAAGASRVLGSVRRTGGEVELHLAGQGGASSRASKAPGGEVAGTSPARTAGDGARTSPGATGHGTGSGAAPRPAAGARGVLSDEARPVVTPGRPVNDAEHRDG